jgi:potassium efflux system protein
LTQRLADAEAEQETARHELTKLKSEKTLRSERRLELPRLLTGAKDRLEAMTAKSEAVGLAPAFAQAQLILRATRRQAIQHEITAYQEELLSYEARGELLEVRIELAERRVAASGESVAAWSLLLEEHRGTVAEAALQEAEREAAQVPPALQSLAQQNLELTQNQRTLNEAIEATKKRSAELEQVHARLEAEYKRIEDRVEAAGLTNAIGQFLRRQRADLPNTRQLQKRIRELRREVGVVQSRILELEDQRSAMGKLEPAVGVILAGLDPSVGAVERNRIEQKAKELLRAQREHLDRLIDNQGVYFAELVDLDVMQRRLLEQTRRFGRYIDENVLWIKSGPLLGPSALLSAGEALLWLVRPEGWKAIADSIWGTMRASPLLSLAFILLVGAMLGTRSRLQKPLIHSGVGFTGSFRHSLEPFALTFLLAASWPALLWLLSWLLVSPYESSEFAKSVAAGLRASAVVLLSVDFVWRLCADRGIGAKLFKWPKTVRHALRKQLRWLVWLIIPAALLSGIMDFQANEAYRESLGRIAFILTFAALAIAARQLLRLDGQVLRRFIGDDRQGWLFQLRYVWYGLVVGIPAGLALTALAGYYYTAYFLSWRLVETFWLLLGLILLDALVHHWLKLRMQQRALQEAGEQNDVSDAAEGDGMQVRLEDEELDEASVSAQAAQMLRTLVLVGAVAGSWLIWGETLPALSVLDQVNLWSTQIETSETITRPDGSTGVSKLIQQVPITLADLGLSLLIIVVTFVASRNVPGLLEIVILDRLPFAPSIQYAITSLTKYIIAAVGIVIAFNAIGVSWSKVQWLVAAMTVGLAFGLQEIFANFVSGIIILFERPIRVGDVVTVGNVSGVVSRIRIRATTITDWDRKELIVPNKRFITTEILNWTLSDAIIRVVFPVAVSRGSELEDVRTILLDIALAHRLVLADPPPSVVFTGFGPGTLRFDLRVFIRRDDFAKVMDAVNTAIEEGLTKAGVEIAAERQEIQVRPPRDIRPGEKSPSFPGAPNTT